ncbi:uncharacterized protein [Antedon mediterranea]|uniref:uncharacterized protein n=1 Tax=Antedon mediterranea TaxID=105859 RepID=UPI003AF9569C
MFEKMKRILGKALNDNIGPPIPPRPDIPTVSIPISPERKHNKETRNSHDKNPDRNGLQNLWWSEDLKTINCYYDIVEYSELVKMMNPHIHQTGAYLIRRSNSSPYALTISVVHTRLNIYHFKVMPQNDRYEVTKNLRFPTIQEVIDYFMDHDIPGSQITDLKLTMPIDKPKIVRTARSVELQMKRRVPRMRRVSEPDPIAVQQPLPIEARPPLPTPPVDDPVYQEVTDNHDVSKFVMDMCAIQDQQQRRQKCKCGLYYDESLLIDNWMMHRSMASENLGRLFFVNDLSQKAMWTLPQQVQSKLKRVDPSRYLIFQRLQRECQ